METADFVCSKGAKNVILVEMLAKAPVLPIAAHAQMLYRRLAEGGAKLVFNTRVKRIEKGAVIVETDGAERKLEPVDQVIVAVGVVARQDLKAMLQKKKIRHFIVGDTREPRRIIEATTEGAKAAWEI